MECPKLVTRPLICDVRDREQVKAALENLPADWKTIDLLINNAGLVIGVDKEFEGSLDEWIVDHVASCVSRHDRARAGACDQYRFYCR